MGSEIKVLKLINYERSANSCQGFLKKLKVFSK